MTKIKWASGMGPLGIQALAPFRVLPVCRRLLSSASAVESTFADVPHRIPRGVMVTLGILIPSFQVRALAG